jgi:hypothetical protein
MAVFAAAVPCIFDARSGWPRWLLAGLAGAASLYAVGSVLTRMVMMPAAPVKVMVEDNLLLGYGWLVILGVILLAKKLPKREKAA